MRIIILFFIMLVLIACQTASTFEIIREPHYLDARMTCLAAYGCRLV